MKSTQFWQFGILQFSQVLEHYHILHIKTCWNDLKLWPLWFCAQNNLLTDCGALHLLCVCVFVCVCVCTLFTISKAHKTLYELLFTILIWRSISVRAVRDTVNRNPILSVNILTWKSLCYCAWITVIKCFSWVCGTIFHTQFICLKGTDNWNVKHTLLKRTQYILYILYQCVMNVFPDTGLRCKGEWKAGLQFFLITIWIWS